MHGILEPVVTSNRSRMLLFCIFVTIGSTCCWLFFPSHLQHSSSVLVCSSDLPSPVFIHLFFWVLQVCGRPSCSPDSSCCWGRLWGASRWLTWNSNDGRTLLWSLWRLLLGGSCDIQHSCATSENFHNLIYREYSPTSCHGPLVDFKGYRNACQPPPV